MSPEQGKILIDLARLSIITFFDKRIIHHPQSDQFNQLQGVFVTLHKFGRLRGCIGYPYPEYLLKRAIIQAARSAAFDDPRFSPLTSDEVHDIEIEISVLSIPQKLEVDNPLDYLDRIDIGSHGLIITKENHSGLLLPQVFAQIHATPKQALEMTCEKAGLSKHDWQHKDTSVFVFTAQVFSEH